MKIGALAAVSLAVSCLLMPASLARADDDAALFRVFLKDGSSLVSYGEVARVGDRVVFSMRADSTSNAPLQLVDLAADRIDWDRTDRYALSVRAGHYIETQAEIDYAALSNQVAQALNNVVREEDPAKRLATVEQARKSLSEWPQTHYNYREADVRQMLGVLDEAIADLRAASGGNRFNVSLVAFSGPAPRLEPLLPKPTLQESIEQTLSAARLSDSPANRTALLRAALGSIDREQSLLDPTWAATTWVSTKGAIDTEERLDRSYQLLTARIMRLASQRARMADVRGVERLVTNIQQRDAVLGASRPDAINALMAAVQEKLDATRRLRLARDRYLLRAPAFREYWLAVRGPIGLFAQLKPLLEDIKSLAGSSPAALASIEGLVSQMVELATAITPPAEFEAAHALLVSSAHLAENAARMRRAATMANDLTGAWNASSAAAGSLMLGTRARTEIQTLLRPPQLQ